MSDRIPRHDHAFDFWLGDWSLAWGDSGIATNRIVREMDGHVIAEHFEDAAAGYRGSSWSVYDSLNDRWQQTWVDSQGGYFTLTGGLEQDRMVLHTAPFVADGQRRYRMVFYDITPETFRWDWSITEDGGATWTLKWGIHYTRRS